MHREMCFVPRVENPVLPEIRVAVRNLKTLAVARKR